MVILVGDDIFTFFLSLLDFMVSMVARVVMLLRVDEHC